MEVTICSYSILTNLRVHTTRLTTANCDFRILTSTRQMHNITSYLGIFENGRCDSYYRSTSKPELLACLHPSSQRRCGCCGDITAKAVGPSIYSLFSVPRMARPLPSAPSSSSATHEIRRFSDQLLGVEADEKGGGVCCPYRRALDRRRVSVALRVTAYLVSFLFPAILHVPLTLPSRARHARTEPRFAVLPGGAFGETPSILYML